MVGKRILLVDDEPMVANSVKMILTLDRHTVEMVTSGPEALERYVPGKYHLVITDCRMPGMTGAQLAEQIKAQHPTQPILMLTGFPPAEPMPSVDAVMLKPFSGIELRRIVHELAGA